MAKSFEKLAKDARSTQTIKILKRIKKAQGAAFGVFYAFLDPKQNVMLFVVTDSEADPKGARAKTIADDPVVMKAMGIDKKKCRTARGMVQGTPGKQSLVFWVRQGTASPSQLEKTMTKMASTHSVKVLKGAKSAKYAQKTFEEFLKASAFNDGFNERFDDYDRGGGGAFFRMFALSGKSSRGDNSPMAVARRAEARVNAALRQAQMVED